MRTSARRSPTMGFATGVVPPDSRSRAPSLLPYGTLKVPYWSHGEAAKERPVLGVWWARRLRDPDGQRRVQGAPGPRSDSGALVQELRGGAGRSCSGEAGAGVPRAESEGRRSPEPSSGGACSGATRALTAASRRAPRWRPARVPEVRVRPAAGERPDGQPASAPRKGPSSARRDRREQVWERVSGAEVQCPRSAVSAALRSSWGVRVRRRGTVARSPRTAPIYVRTWQAAGGAT